MNSATDDRRRSREGLLQIGELRLIKQMKPLGLSIEEMRALMRARKELESRFLERERAKAVRDSLGTGIRPA